MSNLELNKGDNFIFLVDVSASMAARDTPSGDTRLNYLKEKVSTFIGEAAKYDDDGIDLITFGHAVTVKPKLTSANAASLLASLSPNEGSTETAKAIAKAYEIHKAGGYKQTVVFVATDGEPNNKDDVRDTIRTIAADIKDEHEFAISFLKVGTDPGVAAFLEELDDSLKAKHDIVDVKSLDEVDFMTAFIGALHD